MHTLLHAAQRRSVPGDYPGLTSLHALVYIGRLDTADRMQHALQAIGKAARLEQGQLRLIVGGRVNGACVVLPGDAPCVLAEHKLKRLVDAFYAKGKLLLPCRNEHFGDVFLHALCSGLPLEAVNYQTLGPTEAGALGQAGDAFVGMAWGSSSEPPSLVDLHRRGKGEAPRKTRRERANAPRTVLHACLAN
jgi:hypothetical protein